MGNRWKSRHPEDAVSTDVVRIVSWVKKNVWMDRIWSKNPVGEQVKIQGASVETKVQLLESPYQGNEEGENV